MTADRVQDHSYQILNSVLIRSTAIDSHWEGSSQHVHRKRSEPLDRAKKSYEEVGRLPFRWRALKNMKHELPRLLCWAKRCFKLRSCCNIASPYEEGTNYKSPNSAVSPSQQCQTL